MRKILVTLSLFIMSITIIIGVVMIDGYRIYRFRTTQDEIPKSAAIDETGLRNLNLSGSNRIVFRDLNRKLEHYSKKKYFINLSDKKLQYIDDFISDFFGVEEEKPNFKHYIRRLLILGKVKADSLYEISDADVAERYGFSYIFIPQEKQGILRSDFVDHFVAAIEEIPSDAWIHVYSHGGRGRTSIGMLMIDIIRNGGEVSLEDIVKRQHLLGSENVFDLNVWRNGTYTHQQLVERKNFITEFYAYMQERKKNPDLLWQDWQEQSLPQDATNTNL